MGGKSKNTKVCRRKTCRPNSNRPPKKRRRKGGGRFPTARHEHLLGLIGRSHFPAPAQTEEREERMRFNWDRGNTIFTSSANGPTTDPWGTLLTQGTSSEMTPTIWSWHDGFDRYDLIQFSTAPPMPGDFSLASRN